METQGLTDAYVDGELDPERYAKLVRQHHEASRPHGDAMSVLIVLKDDLSKLISRIKQSILKVIKKGSKGTSPE